jgi:hypothetical protein
MHSRACLPSVALAILNINPTPLKTLDYDEEKINTLLR